MSARNGSSNSHLHNTPIPLVKFKFNPTYCSGANVIWRFSRWLPCWPSWISRHNRSSYSKSPCCPTAFHQGPLPSTKVRLNPIYRSVADNNWRISNGYHLGYRNKMILATLKSHVAQMPPTKFWFIPTYPSEADVVWRVLRWPPWCPSWMPEQIDFSNSESLLFRCLQSSFSSIQLRVRRRSL